MLGLVLVSQTVSDRNRDQRTATASVFHIPHNFVSRGMITTGKCC